MKRILIVAILIILILSLVACKEEPILESLEYDEVKSFEKELKSHKKPFIKGTIEAEDYLDRNQTVEFLIEFITYASKYQKQKSMVQNISLEDVKSDLDDYFLFLKKCYAGYKYFGGDEKFLTAKNNIIEGIPSDGISGNELEKLIKNELSFVEDIHFTIGNNQDLTETKHVEVSNLLFRKSEKGFYNTATNKFIDEETNINEYLKPTLDSNNRICYKLIANYNSDYPDKIIYIDGSVENLKWQDIKFKVANSPKKAELKVINEIPYLKFDSCYFKAYSQEDYDIVLEGARTLSKSKYAILDLRGNGGGNGFLPGEWIKNYSGNDIVYSQDGLICGNKELFSHSSNGQTYDEMMEYMGIEPYDDNHYFFRGSDETFEKEGLLIVLIDGTIASAGEYLVDALHHYSNTLFVGMPTVGALRSSIVTNYFMPNTGILVAFGNILMFPNEAYFQEYRGFEPDIWLISMNQEEQLFRLLYMIRDLD